MHSAIDSVFDYTTNNSIIDVKGCDEMKNKYKYDFVLIGKRIATARKDSKMTQEQLAERVGVGVKHISEIERGAGGTAIGTFMKIIAVLNVSSDYILFGENIESSPLSTKFEKLLPRQKRYLEEIMDTFIECCLDNEVFLHK